MGERPGLAVDHEIARQRFLTSRAKCQRKASAGKPYRGDGMPILLPLMVAAVAASFYFFV